jgi:arginine decarboxylase
MDQSVLIKLSSAIGKGPTVLAAFDEALLGAGIANLNIIRLSSVIPPHAQILREKPVVKAEDFGRRLYAVLADNRTDKVGETVAAGVGWVMRTDDNYGLFVEHEGRTAVEVEAMIQASLAKMVKSRGGDFTPIQSEVVEVKCEGEPVCALVSAAYKIEVW